MQVKLENVEVCSNCKQIYHNRIIKRDCKCGNSNIVSIFNYLENSKYSTEYIE